MTTPNDTDRDPDRIPPQSTGPIDGPTPIAYRHRVPHTEREVQAHHDAPARHRGHGLMMLVCCVPMVVIAALLVFTGVAGSGAIVSALLCMGMMAAMMFLMPGGHGGHDRK